MLIIPRLEGYTVHRIEDTEKGEFLVEETPTVFGLRTKKCAIIRLSKDDIKEWEGAESKENVFLFFNDIIWIGWRLLTVFSVIAMLALLVWYVTTSLELAIFTFFIAPYASGAEIADLCDLSDFEHRDINIRENATVYKQRILTRNALRGINPSQVGSTYVLMPRKRKLPPQ